MKNHLVYNLYLILKNRRSNIIKTIINIVANKKKCIENKLIVWCNWYGYISKYKFMKSDLLGYQ